jgi:hypothetical protein
VLIFELLFGLFFRFDFPAFSTFAIVARAEELILFASVTATRKHFLIFQLNTLFFLPVKLLTTAIQSEPKKRIYPSVRANSSHAKLTTTTTIN